jgi:glycolate oxidase FAD binding subunit
MMPPASAKSTTAATIETIAPADQAELLAAVREAVAERSAIYPLGGGTASGYGLVTKTAGRRPATTGLNRVIDYPARDMTVTVEAGITIAELAGVLAAENQMLPVDIAEADTATLGGAIAVNFSGPRRYGYGTLRDYVIGISAIDGHGTPFHAGGRVVKNVAGYDFCKLLTGSLGTLAVISQVTLKVRPRPEAAMFLAVDLATAEQAATLLEGLARSRTTPSAVELLVGDAWNDETWNQGPTAAGHFAELVVRLEGTEPEVGWMTEQLRSEWQAAGVDGAYPIEGSEAQELLDDLTRFGCDGPPVPWVLKFNVRPSRVVEMCARVRKAFPKADLLAHAGNGVILAKPAGAKSEELAAHELANPLLGELRQAVAADGGQVIVWNSPTPEELTRVLAWGPARDDDAMMRRLKNQFDPHNLLNPGRFQF